MNGMLVDKRKSARPNLIELAEKGENLEVEAWEGEDWVVKFGGGLGGEFGKGLGGGGLGGEDWVVNLVRDLVEEAWEGEDWVVDLVRVLVEEA
ncbi:hypothetical protein CYMTET_44283 [Cymbomonas tetramitiformis]|uniref:Uncharacterized protein n=1 Tax=Cymbomonas tetramitiformis TaxID=36881 RepID=A0AAE0EZ67_9CHLO|nr:hypothetical protein CYMTET_44283 [Cymbomonas tetramitiformis]